MKIGIMGLGRIAEVMSKTLSKMDGVECYGAASRSLERATAFAEKFGFTKAYGSYEEMVQDKEVELIYVATPHSHHYENMMLCLNYNKPVLCEKSFTVNAKQAREVLALAKEKNVFVGEAIWTRFIPMRKILDEVIASGTVGKPQMLTANLGYVMMQKERIGKPELAGGALLDVGIYTLNFASMIFGNNPKEITGTAVMTSTGVDAQNSITFTYEDGKMAVLNSSATCLSDRKGIVYCEQGFIETHNINNCEKICVYNLKRELIQEYDAPAQISGYEYEVIEAMKAIKEGRIECEEMPHAETICMMEWMDALREQWHMKYPME